MANIANNFYKLLLTLLLLAGLPSVSGAAEAEKEGATNAFKMLKKADSGAFLYDATVDFSKYDKVVLFPIARDQVKVEAGANAEDLKGWDAFGEEEWEKIAGHFDTALHKEFSNSDDFTLTENAGEGVLAIQFRMVEFMPSVKNTRDNTLGTVGESHNLEGLGNLRLRGVLIDSSNKRLLAIIENLNNINAGRYGGTDDRVARNLAWRKSFQRISGDLHDDMEKLRKLKPVQEAPVPQSNTPDASSP